MPAERISPDTLHEATGYTHVVRTSGGGLAFISGQVALRPDGSLAGNDLESQTRQVFANLRAALDAVAAAPADVLKVTHFVVDWNPDRRPALMAGRGDFFGDQPPASTLVGVQALARPDFLIEVEAIVALP